VGSLRLKPALTKSPRILSDPRRLPVKIQSVDTLPPVNHQINRATTTEELILQELQEMNDRKDFYSKLSFA